MVHRQDASHVANLSCFEEIFFHHRRVPVREKSFLMSAFSGNSHPIPVRTEYLVGQICGQQVTRETPVIGLGRVIMA